MRGTSRQMSVSLAVLGLLGVCSLPAPNVLAQWVPAASDAENHAITYSRTELRDAVASLQRAINAGTTELTFDVSTGYLKSVLRALRVPRMWKHSP